MARRAFTELRRKRQQVLLLEGIKRSLIPLLVLAVVAGTGLLVTRAVLRSGLFLVQKIVSNVAFEDLDRVRKEFSGVSLFWIPLSRYAGWIQSGHPEFKEVRLLKVFPHTVKIVIHERRPVAQLLVGKKYYCIDEEAVVVSDGMPQPYPGFVEFSGKAIPGTGVRKGSQLTRDEIRAGLSLLKELLRKKIPQRYQPFHGISIHSLPAVSFELAGIFVQVGEPPYADKVSLLADTLLPEFKDSLNDLKQIDLRFSPPVIGYKR